MDRKKICAVVPAYKEEKRIGIVLKELEKSIVNEIIVVDDGSDDNTEEVVKQFKGVRYIKNFKNMGKGYSMEKGVEYTDAEIIFFCDADLKNLTSQKINKIILPVFNGGYEMSVGLRRPFKNKWFLWSGQRALERDLWDRLPVFYKDKFRVEIGLNLYCKSCCVVIVWFNQHLKEKKRGLVWGVYRRFFMYRDVCVAIINFYINKVK